MKNTSHPDRQQDCEATVAGSAQMVQLLSTEGTLQTDDTAAEYLPFIDALSDDALRQFYRDMVITRRFDLEATNLQRRTTSFPPTANTRSA